MKVMEITDPFKKQKVADTILRALPEWFGLEELSTVDNYIVIHNIVC